MRLFVCPRFTLSLSGTHALRSLLRSLRHVLPSEGVAVSVSRYCIARGKAHTGPGDKHAGAGSRDKYSHQVCSRACMRLFTGPIRSVSGESISAAFTAAVDSLIGGNENNCHIPPTHFFRVGGFSHLRDFCPRTPAFCIGVFHEFNCFPPNLAFSIGKKQDNCLFPPTEIGPIVGGKSGNEKTCLHFFEAWA